MLHEDHDQGCHACAILDIAIEEPEGLADISELKVAKQLVSRLSSRITPDQLLLRISNSPFPVELLQYLPHVYGPMKDQLRPVAELLHVRGSGYFDDDALREFADLYWSAVVQERILRKDYSRAFNEVKRAFRGLEVDPSAPAEQSLYEAPIHGEAKDLAASRSCVRKMLYTLHTAMHDAGLVKDILADNQMKRWFCSDIPGGLFAKAIMRYDSERDPGFGLPGLQAIAIASYLNAEKNKGRKRRREKKMQQAA